MNELKAIAYNDGTTYVKLGLHVQYLERDALERAKQQIDAAITAHNDATPDNDPRAGAQHGTVYTASSKPNSS